MERQKIQSYKGFETTLNRLFMESKMHMWILFCLIVLHLTVFAFVWFTKMPAGTLGVIVDYTFSSMLGGISPNTAERAEALKPVAEMALSISSKFLLYAASVYLLHPVILIYFWKKAKKLQEAKHLRGAVIISAAELKKQMSKAREKTHLKIGEVDYPISAEVKHSFVIGRPGSGKTVCLSEIIEKLRNEKCIIYDFKGDFVSRFYRHEEDILFNPLDSRSVNWNIFSDIENKLDVEAIANSLVPQSQTTDTEKFFAEAARSVFAGILENCIANEKKTHEEVWKLVSSPIGSVAGILHSIGHPGYTYIQDAGGKQSVGVQSTLMQFAACFRYMQQDVDFSFRRWLQQDGKGCLFVTNYSDMRDILRPILSLVIDLLSRKLLAMPDDLDRRVYFFLDEFGTLQRLSSIVQLLTLSRSKGGSVWIGIQDIGQIDQLYRKELRQALVNACATSVMFSVSDSDTAEFLSRRVGEREIIEVEESHSMGPESMRDGLTISKRKKKEALILPSEFQNLADMEAYVKLPNYSVAKTKLEWKKYPAMSQSFISRRELML